MGRGEDVMDEYARVTAQYESVGGYHGARLRAGGTCRPSVQIVAAVRPPAACRSTRPPWVWQISTA